MKSGKPGKPLSPADRFAAERAAAKRAAINALKRARRKADKAGIELSEWEGEFLGSVEDRVKTYGRAFGDPEKGGHDAPHCGPRLGSTPGFVKAIGRQSPASLDRNEPPEAGDFALATGTCPDYVAVRADLSIVGRQNIEARIIIECGTA